VIILGLNTFLIEVSSSAAKVNISKQATGVSREVTQCLPETIPEILETNLAKRRIR